MKQILQFQASADDPRLVHVEVETSSPQPGPELAGLGEPAVKVVSQTFDDALDLLRPLATSVITKLQDAAPHEISLEFGLKFTAQAGAVITSASTEANCKVTLTWKAGERTERPGTR